MKIIEIIKNINSKWVNINKTIRMIISIICFTISYIVYLQYNNNMGKKEYSRFYSSEINGKIAEIKMGKGISYFNTNKNEPYFRFCDLSSLSASGKYDFGNFAKLGDSVYKAAYGDTVYLFQKGIVYKYTFVHLE